MKNFTHLMGVLPLNKLHEQDVLLTTHFPIIQETLPNSYDVTSKWAECKSVVTIIDQSNCGSCWVWLY